jgi:hypothetical protein
VTDGTRLGSPTDYRSSLPVRSMLRIFGSRVAQTVRIAVAPAKQQHQQQHLRFLAKDYYKGDRPGGGDDGGASGFGLRMVYCKDDMENSPYDEETVRFKNNATMKDVRKSIEEYFGMEGDDFDGLEYYLNGKWKPLKDPGPLKGKSIVPLRHAPTFDEGGPEDDYIDGAANDDATDDGADTADTDGAEDTEDEDEYGLKEYKESGSVSDAEKFFEFPGDSEKFAKLIRDIVADLYHNQYVHDAAKLQLQSRTGEVISTKDYIKKKALNDAALQKALVSKIGCLDHIVQCTHFSFLWRQVDNESKEVILKDDEP